MAASLLFSLSGEDAKASLSALYPQFRQVDPPRGSVYTEAWLGDIQPFGNDFEALAALNHFERRAPLHISAGRLFSTKAASLQHWAHPLLVNMGIKCRVLICLRPGFEPAAYLLDPCFEQHYTNQRIHPHPRLDQILPINGRMVPGLCVVSAAEFQYVAWLDRMTQYLDQLSQYLGNHLIWLRTRRLYRATRDGVHLLYTPTPGEQIQEAAPIVQVMFTPQPVRYADFWKGYWPGPSAVAANPRDHVKCLAPGAPCWCGAHIPYGQCHRPREIASLPADLQRWYGAA